MRVCQINCVYGVGSTGKLTRYIHQSLRNKGYDSFVIVPNSNNYTSDDGVFVVSNRFLSMLSAGLRRGLGMQYDWAFIQTNRIIKILKDIKPDVVHLQCINGNNINIYMLLRYLAKNNIKTIYTLHAEFPYTGGCGHAYDCERWKTGCGECSILTEATQSPFIDGTHRTWKKLTKAYSLFQSPSLKFTAVSPWLVGRAEQSPMLRLFQKYVVMNGVDTSVFNRNIISNEWRSRLGLNKDEKIIVHVTASFYPHEENLKGGKFVIQLAERLADSPVKIIVAANYGSGDNLPDNVIYIGRTDNQQELAELYREADLTIITSKRETFSMPVAESMCCGTPVVGFEAGGPESIALREYSDFVKYGDTDLLTRKTLEWLQKQINKNALSELARKSFSDQTMTELYTKIYLT